MGQPKRGAMPSMQTMNPHSPEHLTASGPTAPTAASACPAAVDAQVQAMVLRQALQLALRVLDLAETQARPHELCQAHAQVARCLKAMGDLASAERHLRKALAGCAGVHGMDLRVDLLCELADLSADQAQQMDGRNAAERRTMLERARDLGWEAAHFAARTTDSHWEARLLLRVADVLERCGDPADAMHLQQRALALLGLQDPPTESDPVSSDGLRALAPPQLM